MTKNLHPRHQQRQRCRKNGAIRPSLSWHHSMLVQQLVLHRPTRARRDLPSQVQSLQILSLQPASYAPRHRLAIDCDAQNVWLRLFHHVDVAWQACMSAGLCPRAASRRTSP